MLFPEGRRRHHTYVDRSVYGDELHGLYHGHEINEKVWGWGQEPMMSWGQTHAWGTCFAELQTGVAPTQSHSFPLGAHSQHQHCEVFKPLAGLARPGDLYSDNYTAAVGAVDAWAESAAGLPEVPLNYISFN